MFHISSLWCNIFLCKCLEHYNVDRINIVCEFLTWCEKKVHHPCTRWLKEKKYGKTRNFNYEIKFFWIGKHLLNQFRGWHYWFLLHLSFSRVNFSKENPQQIQSYWFLWSTTLPHTSSINPLWDQHYETWVI